MAELNIVVRESTCILATVLMEAPGCELQTCIVYRKLNSVAKIEFFPLHNIEKGIKLYAATKDIIIDPHLYSKITKMILGDMEEFCPLYVDCPLYVPRVLKWSLTFLPFDFKVVHHAGKNNCHTDALSH